MNKTRTFLMLSALFITGAILPSLGEDDAAFASATSRSDRLDLRTGTRIATEGVAERMTYSPRWGHAVSCAIDGLGGSPFTATEESETEWARGRETRDAPGVTRDVRRETRDDETLAKPHRLIV